MLWCCAMAGKECCTEAVCKERCQWCKVSTCNANATNNTPLIPSPNLKHGKKGGGITRSATATGSKLANTTKS